MPGTASLNGHPIHYMQILKCPMAHFSCGHILFVLQLPPYGFDLIVCGHNPALPAKASGIQTYFHSRKEV